MESGQYQKAIQQADEFLNMIKNATPESKAFTGGAALLYAYRGACYEALGNQQRDLSQLKKALSDYDRSLVYHDLMENRYDKSVLEMRNKLIDSRLKLERQIKAIEQVEPEKKWWQIWK